MEIACAEATLVLQVPSDRLRPDFIRVRLANQSSPLTDLTQVQQGDVLVFETAAELIPSDPRNTPVMKLSFFNADIASLFRFSEFGFYELFILAREPRDILRAGRLLAAATLQPARMILCMF